jgi:Putative ABC exporter
MFLIDPALAKLLWLRFRGRLRRLLRAATSVRGGLFLVLGGIMVLTWLGGMIVPLIVGMRGPRPDPENLRSFAPGVLLVLCLFTVMRGGEQAIAFAPAEVDLLFAGPFTRRQLLAYKLLAQALGTAATAAFFLIWLAPLATLLVAVYLGTVLALLFLQMVSLAVMQISQTVEAAAYSRGRKLLLWAVVIALAIGLGQAALAAQAAAEEGWLAVWQQFQQSMWGRLLLAPFDVFGRAMSAQRVWPDFLMWGGLAAALDGALIGLVLWLDANFLEVALVASQRRSELIQRARRGGLSGWSSSVRTKGRLRRFPWMGGAGPVAWRQATSALRQSRQLLFLLIVLGFAVGGPMLFTNRNRFLQPAAIGGAAAWVTFMMTMLLRLDFRGELENFDWLKSLPLRSRAVALGELVTPVALMTLLHWLAIVLLAVGPLGPRPWLLPLAILAPPANAVLFGVENFFFLLFPIRTGPGNPFDLQTIGRAIVLMGAKVGVLGVCAALVAAVGGGVYFLAGGSITAGLSSACVVLVGQAVAAVAAVGWAYERFDVSTDLPG